MDSEFEDSNLTESGIEETEIGIGIDDDFKSDDIDDDDERLETSDINFVDGKDDIGISLNRFIWRA